jgi:hypothetical protein
MPSDRSLGDFLGRWDITRKIVPSQGPHADFSGQGVWRAATGGAAYRETGLLNVQGAAPMTAERGYFWGDDLAVLFEDGRFFHQVPPGGGRATHFCDPDTYVVEYDFAGWPAFSVTYTVTGPRKDYVMHSHYTRAAAG